MVQVKSSKSKYNLIREAAKKNPQLMARRANKRVGGGGKGGAIKEKKLFLKLFKKILLPFKK